MERLYDNLCASVLSSRFLYHLLSSYVSSDSGKSKSDEISPGELLSNYVMGL